ncbi:MAG: hypothetical protein Q9204_007824 [Flavoplaca sp. TL-2023a]
MRRRFPVINAHRFDKYRTPSPDDHLPSSRRAVSQSPHRDRRRLRPERVGGANADHQQRQRARRRAKKGILLEDHHESSSFEGRVTRPRGPAAGEEQFWQPTRNSDKSKRAQTSGTKSAKSGSSTNETHSWESATADGETETLGSATPRVSKQASLQSSPERSSRPGESGNPMPPFTKCGTDDIGTEPVNPSLSIMVFPTVIQEEPVTTRWTSSIERARQHFEKWRDAFIAAEGDSDRERCEENRNNARNLHSRLIAMDRAERNSSSASASVVRPERRTSSSNSPSERRSGSDVNGETSEDSGGEETDRSTSPPEEEDSHPRSLHHHYCQVQKRRKSRRAKPE